MSTCNAALGGLSLFVDLFAVVDVGSSPTASASTRRLAMLAIVQFVVLISRLIL